MNALFEQILDFLLPRRCPLCGHLVGGSKTMLCAKCALETPFALENDTRDNELARLFWHILPVEKAFHLMHYLPDSPSAALITAPKFNRRDDIAIGVGRLLAMHTPKEFFEDIDVIVPMPSYKKRLRQRGMNHIAIEVEAMLGELGLPIPVAGDAVKRIRYVKSQIGLAHGQRIGNVKSEDFEVRRPEMLEGRHILIVDDVITTGTSVYSLARAIMAECKGVRFSILAVARGKID